MVLCCLCWSSWRSCCDGTRSQLGEKCFIAQSAGFFPHNVTWFTCFDGSSTPGIVSTKGLRAAEDVSGYFGANGLCGVKMLSVLLAWDFWPAGLSHPIWSMGAFSCRLGEILSFFTVCATQVLGNLHALKDSKILEIHWLTWAVLVDWTDWEMINVITLLAALFMWIFCVNKNELEKYTMRKNW